MAVNATQRRPVKNSLVRWIDDRLPFVKMAEDHLLDYPTPRNLNYFWNFGSIAGIVLVTMILTGIFLAMHYTPHVDYAFNSVEAIMRDVNGGWLIRYIHMVGASMFFFAVYIHIFRGLYYGSYKSPRELLWIIGVVILLLMMATAFMGYVLPWGQMSFWGATVITNLFSAIPLVGQHIVTWLWGGFSVDNPTLNRFFALHYLLPFIIVAVVGLHLVALHTHGSNNPLGIDKKGPQDSIPFHPYYTIKDMYGLAAFALLYGALVFFAPNLLGEPDNYIPANPLQTPPHIVPEWYLLPFYAILRSIPNKLLGVCAMFGSILLLCVLPWLDGSKVRSATFRPIYKWVFWLLPIDCLILGYVGAHPPEGALITIGQLATLYYFLHFLVIIPIIGRIERPLPLPSSIATAVLGKGRVAGLLVLVGLGLAAMPARAAEEGVSLKDGHFPFRGIFGTYDRGALQRGYQIYNDVCSNCHSLSLLAYRNLADLGFSPEEVKAIAAAKQVNVNGADRPATPADHFALPNPAVTAAFSAKPPDLSVIAKARSGGADYVYSLLQGYTKPPAGVQVANGVFYNEYFPGHQIAMPQPLQPDQVQYADGTQASLEQEAHDIASFLAWASEPELEKRHQLGVKAMLFMIILTGMLYAVKRRIWSDVH